MFYKFNCLAILVVSIFLTGCVSYPPVMGEASYEIPAIADNKQVTVLGKIDVKSYLKDREDAERISISKICFKHLSSNQTFCAPISQNRKCLACPVGTLDDYVYFKTPSGDIEITEVIAYYDGGMSGVFWQWEFKLKNVKMSIPDTEELVYLGNVNAGMNRPIGRPAEFFSIEKIITDASSVKESINYFNSQKQMSFDTMTYKLANWVYPMPIPQKMTKQNYIDRY